MKIALLVLFSLPFLALVGWLGWVMVSALRAEHDQRLSPTEFNPNRFYVNNWRPREGWPRGPFLNYECARCGQVLPSKPTQPKKCECGNLAVDSQSVRAEDETKVRLFEEKPDGLV